MIDEKKIEERANEEYPLQTDGHIIGRYAYKKGYKDAIQEFLKELWHDGCELPKRSTGTAIVIHNGGTIQTVFVTYLYSIIKDYGKHCHIKCWCYLNDLFERQKGGSNERI